MDQSIKISYDEETKKFKLTVKNKTFLIDQAELLHLKTISCHQVSLHKTRLKQMQTMTE